MFHYFIYLIIVLIGVSLIGIILNLLIRKKMNESNSILWLCIGFVVILAGLFPHIVVKLSNLFFITYPPAFVFTVAIIILLFIVLKNTIHISELTAKLQEIATEVSILRHDINELKKQMEKSKDKISDSKDGE